MSKMHDGLCVYAARSIGRHDQIVVRSDAFADEALISMGYHPNVAASIIDRLMRKGYIDYGVSARSGWITDKGMEALAAKEET